MRYSQGRDSAPAHHRGCARAAAARPAGRAARLAGWGRVMAKIGYARVPARGQNDDSQAGDLTACGCGKIFAGTASGKNAARPGARQGAGLPARGRRVRHYPAVPRDAVA